MPCNSDLRRAACAHMACLRLLPCWLDRSAAQHVLSTCSAHLRTLDLPCLQVSLARTHGYRGVHLVQFSGGMGWQMGQGAALTLRCGLVCGVPPPNSTAMAASRQEGGGACGSAGACHSPFDFS